MSRLITLTRWEFRDERFVIVEEVSKDYAGVWGYCKKGRETVEQNMKADQATAAQNRGNAQTSYNVAQGNLMQDLKSSAPGSLTPASTAQLASDRDNIASTYNGIRQTAFRTMGQRGLGSAPSGFAQTAANSADLGEATQGTAAYRNAQLATERQNNFATGQEVGLSGQQGSLGNAASGESTTAAVDRSKMGSTAGDVLGAVAEVAPIVAAPFTGGASLIPSLAGGFKSTNPFSKMGKIGTGVGTYSPNSYGPSPDQAGFGPYSKG